ncbi:uncharacterized protein [Primulina huaijiensis]|uniref:uncharacterized protein n=1 Tax=Primulina huaijiensis TaxID=1492673 RepID=UPI003CC6F1FB
MSIIHQNTAKENGGVSFHYPMLTPPQLCNMGDKDREDILLQIAKKKTAKDTWDSLKTKYLSGDRVKKARVQTLKSEFDALRMKETETIDEFAGKLSAINSKFSTLGDTLEDSSLVKKLLDSVPEKFFPIVAGIEQFYDLETMPFEEAIGRLKAYEERTMRLRGNTNSTEGQLLFTHAEWQARQKGSNSDTSLGGKGRGSSGPDRGKWRGRGQYRSKRRDDEAHLTRATDEEPALLMAVSQEVTHTRREKQDAILLSEERLLPEMYRGDKNGENEDIWYLDNGASNHMTGHRDKFQELDEAVTGRVKFGDGSTIQIMGKGTVVFDCKNGDQKVLQEVYYIPKLCSNIISLGKMTEDGNEVHM